MANANTIFNKSSLDSGYLHSQLNYINFPSSPLKSHFKGQLLEIKGTDMENSFCINYTFRNKSNRFSFFPCHFDIFYVIEVQSNDPMNV